MNLNRILAAKAWVIAGLASVATAAGGKLALSISHLAVPYQILLTFVFPAITILLVNGAFHLITHSARGRRALAGPVWVEGYWFIVTIDAPNDPSPVAPGLMYIHFADPNNDLMVTVYRPYHDGIRTVVNASESVLAVVRESDLHFMNVCQQRYGPNLQLSGEALGVGTFLRDGAERFPTRYAGEMFRFGENFSRKQIAERISDDVIVNNRQKFRERWILETIREKEAAYQSGENSAEPQTGEDPGR